MRIHTTFISFERPELTAKAVTSYLDSVTCEWTAVIVDNGSTPETVAKLETLVATYPVVSLMRLDENRYPGFACNRGWEAAPPGCDFFHRADNDFLFLSGWCEEVERRFAEDEKLGQLGLRTDEEELFAPSNVGGNCMIRRVLWDHGLRYDERPWQQYPPGHSEDSYLSPMVRHFGWEWGRVWTPCILPLASGDWDDPYYAKSYGDRRIERP